MERKPTIEYFRELGFTNCEAKVLAENWRPRAPQTVEEVRQGILWERDNRERITAIRINQEK